MDPACFLEICCKYLKGGQTIESLFDWPVGGKLVMDLRKLQNEVACQSEDLMYYLDSMIEKEFAHDAEFMHKYLDWEKVSHLSLAYEMALLEYKKDHPDAYFSGSSPNSGKLAHGDLYNILKRILLEKL